MIRNKLTLMHFNSAEDLLYGISMLQQHNVPICEVYTPTPIPKLEAKLRIKQLRLGNAVLKFGCLGGIAISTLLHYAFEQKSLIQAGGQSAATILVTVFIMLLTYFLATRLFPSRAPKVIVLKPNDNRYLVVAGVEAVSPDKDIIHLFKYAAAVEISPAIKNIVLS